MPDSIAHLVILKIDRRDDSEYTPARRFLVGLSAAKAAGGITTVLHIDDTAKNILGIIGEWCTIVKGS